MTGRHLIMGASLAIAAWLAFFGDKTPATRIAEPVARPSAASVVAAKNAPAPRSETTPPIAMPAHEPVILVLQPREALLGSAHATASAEGLFSSQSWTPPPPPPPKPLPPPPPVAPALPFTYLGKKVEDDNWEVYLARGEQTYIVREQTLIDGTYRVDAIKPPHLSITYLPLKQGQSLVIGTAD